MNHKFTLPLGAPSPSLSLTQIKAYLDRFTSNITPDSSGFEIGHFFRSYTLTPGSDHSTISAIWGGSAAIFNANEVMITMNPSLYKDFENYLNREFPIPKYAVYGPINPNNIVFPKTVANGEVLGTLTPNQAFEIYFLDQHSNYLDPAFYFQFFLEENLWNIPSGATLPLLKGLNNPRLSIARQPALGETGPFLHISGGSKNSEFLNPSSEIDPIYFSFISNDPIHIQLKNGPLSNASCLVTDVSDVMYKTKKNPPSLNLSGQAPWTLSIENDLKPFHLNYAAANGKKTPGAPLSYEINISSGSLNLNTKIRQDTKDIIRQEYRFHDAPFQAQGIDFIIPARKSIKFNNYSSPNFPANLLQNSNYKSPTDNWVLNANEALLVAEFIQAKYAESWKKRTISNPLEYTKITTPQLTINSSWRNPERNEAVKGVRTSNHQTGKALDLKSIHRGAPDNNVDNIGSFISLMEAGKSFLEELIRLNNAEAASKVEILLEHNSELYWLIRVKAGTSSVESVKGGKFKTDWPAPNNPEEGIKTAAKYATHVHIGWRAKNLNQNLVLPELPKEQDDPVKPTLQNLILIASEDPSVPVEDQLALNYAAESVAQALHQMNPNIPTKIEVVSNALEFLGHLNAFREPLYQIKYFFSFSHAWAKGLTLKNYPDGFDRERLKDPVFLETINQLYGAPPTETPGEDEDAEETPLYIKKLKYGSDDETEIMPHQIRVSNLTYLPKIQRNRIRFTFQQLEKAFLVGCNTANEDVVTNSNFSEAFATLIQKPVYGAAYYSFFFVRNEQGKWIDAEINRQTKPQDLPGVPVILVPGKYGRGSLLGYFYRYQLSLPPSIPAIPLTEDLIKIYERMLKKCSPSYRLKTN